MYSSKITFYFFTVELRNNHERKIKQVFLNSKFFLDQIFIIILNKYKRVFFFLFSFSLVLYILFDRGH